jgi:site-specific recombinase XerC
MENKTLVKEWQNWMTGGGVSRSTHDIRSLQTVLGHSSIATTERYVSVDSDALFKIVITL